MCIRDRGRASLRALRPNQAALTKARVQLREKQQQPRTSNTLGPLMKQRGAILRETTEVTSGEEEDDEEQAQGIPGFWMRALVNSEECAEAVKDRDCDCLKHLMDVEVLPKKDQTMQLKFSFAPNEYFSNKVLTKEIPSMAGTEIKWLPQMNLTRKEARERKPKKGANKTTEDKAKAKAVPSFFQFFLTPDSGASYRETQELMAVELIQEVVPNCVSLFMEPYNSVEELLENEPEQPEVVQDRIARVLDLNTQIEAQTDAVQEQLRVMQREHLAELQPLIEERAEILKTGSLPGFWLQVFLSAGVTVSAKDEKALARVIDVNVTVSPVNSTRVELVFEPSNPVVASKSVWREVDTDGGVTTSGVEFVGPSNSTLQKKTKPIPSILWAFADAKRSSGCPEVDSDDANDLMMILLHEILPNALGLFVQNPDALEFLGTAGEDEDEDEDEDDEDEDEDEGKDGNGIALMAREAAQKSKKRKDSEAGGGINMMHVFTVLILSSIIIQFLVSGQV
eukprot:TRINITY_DN9253_c0_g1_i2.p1 TRINITY_DN9253_c0_g1~~TRINITY_DN9253_c0_g1_i2.p1  ORF type:complete len:510 (+),score=157.05 TRINITY_DN9253_c0_g1_i2:137-1666(+)